MGAAEHVAGATSPQQKIAVRGYTPIEHAYFDVLARKTAGQHTLFVCVGYILRMTLGRERATGSPAPEWTETPNKKFAEISGVTETAVETALALGVKLRLIARERVGRGYRSKATPEFWAEAPPHTPKKVTPKKPAVSAADYPDRAKEEPSAAAAVTSVDSKAALKIVPRGEPPPPLVLMPGEMSRPIPLPEAIRSVVYRNSTDKELRISGIPEAVTLLVSITGNPKCTWGIETPEPAPNTPSALGVSRNGFVDSKRDRVFRSSAKG